MQIKKIFLSLSPLSHLLTYFSHLSPYFPAFPYPTFQLFRGGKVSLSFASPGLQAAPQPFARSGPGLSTSPRPDLWTFPLLYGRAQARACVDSDTVAKQDAGRRGGDSLPVYYLTWGT